MIIDAETVAGALNEMEVAAFNDRTYARDAATKAANDYELFSEAKAVMSDVAKLSEAGIDPSDALMILALVELRTRR